MRGKVFFFCAPYEIEIMRESKREKIISIEKSGNLMFPMRVLDYLLIHGNVLIHGKTMYFVLVFLNFIFSLMGLGGGAI